MSKRFIAGSVCPLCEAEDTILLDKSDSTFTCVSCNQSINFDAENTPEKTDKLPLKTTKITIIDDD